MSISYQFPVCPQNFLKRQRYQSCSGTCKNLVSLNLCYSARLWITRDQTLRTEPVAQQAPLSYFGDQHSGAWAAQLKSKLLNLWGLNVSAWLHNPDLGQLQGHLGQKTLKSLCREQRAEKGLFKGREFSVKVSAALWLSRRCLSPALALPLQGHKRALLCSY